MIVKMYDVPLEHDIVIADKRGAYVPYRDKGYFPDYIGSFESVKEAEKAANERWKKLAKEKLNELCGELTRFIIAGTESMTKEVADIDKDNIEVKHISHFEKPYGNHRD